MEIVELILKDYLFKKFLYVSKITADNRSMSACVPRNSKSPIIGKPKRLQYCLAVRQVLMIKITIPRSNNPKAVFVVVYGRNKISKWVG